MQLLSFCVLASLSFAPALAQTGEMASRSMKGILSVEVVVEDPSPELPRQGLTAALVRTDIELKLRAAGITVLDSPPNVPPVV